MSAERAHRIASRIRELLREDWRLRRPPPDQLDLTDQSTLGMLINAFAAAVAENLDDERELK